MKSYYKRINNVDSLHLKICLWLSDADWKARQIREKKDLIR